MRETAPIGRMGGALLWVLLGFVEDCAVGSTEPSSHHTCNIGRSLARLPQVYQHSSAAETVSGLILHLNPPARRLSREHTMLSFQSLFPSLDASGWEAEDEIIEVAVSIAQTSESRCWSGPLHYLTQSDCQTWKFHFTTLER